MKRLAVTGLAVIALAVACAQNDRPPGSLTSVAGPALNEISNLPPALQTLTPRVLSPAESAIIDTLAMINPAGAEMTRRLLSDRHVASISLPDARSQALLARLDSIRRAATAAVLAAQTASDISASLALVDHLDDTTATAEVIRRAGNQPGDLILLPSGTATGKHLSTALGALFKLRKQFGDVPLKNMHVVLHGLKQPTKWSSDMVSQADGMVQRLKNDTLVTIRGVGRARMTRIPMTATTATAAVGVVHP